MARKVIGPTGSRRRHWLLLFCLVVTVGAAAVFIPSALAVHDTGEFQLDNNAQQAVTPSAGQDDWDNVVLPLDANGNSEGAGGGDAVRHVFRTDYYGGKNDDTFTQGTSEDEDMNQWHWADNAAANDKNDLEHAYAAIYQIPNDAPDNAGHEVLYVGADRFANNGDSGLGFMFLQSGLGKDDCGGAAFGSCTGGSFTDGSGGVPHHTAGDLYIVSQFTGGGQANTIDVYTWDPTLNSGDGDWSLEATGSDCDTSSSPDFACATVFGDGNNGTNLTEPSPWPFQAKFPQGIAANTFAEGTFFEGGVDLSHFNLAGCFQTILADTSQSQNLGESMQDFVFGNFDLCSVQVTKSGPELSKEGDTGTFTYTITNTGQQTLYKHSIADDKLGDLTSSAPASCDSLAPGASCTFTADHTFQAGDPDPYTNTVTVQYTGAADGTGGTVSDSDEHTTELFQPSIDFSKTVDVTLSKIGDTANYTLTLDNTSSTDSPDLNCEVTDPTLGVDDSFTIASGDSHDTTASHTFQAGDPDPYTNTATATCSPDGFPNVLTKQDSAEVNLFQPSIDFSKTADVTLSKIGDTANYTLTLDNTSSADTPDLNCEVTDPTLGVDDTFTIASGDSHDTTASHTFQAGDPDPYVNTASVTCSPDGFPNVLTASDDWSVNLFQPSIDFSKTADVTLSKIGHDANYTLTLDNTSSLDTPDLTCEVTDPTLGVDDTFTVASGDSHDTLASHTFAAGDPDPYENTASVSCSPDGFPNVLTASDDWSVNLFQPSVDVEKTGPTYSKATDTAHYTVTITNTSSDDSPALELDSIDDSLVGAIDATGSGCEELAPGDSCTVSYDYVVPSPFPGNSLTNTVTVHYHPDGWTNDITDTDSFTATIVHPSFTITKICATQDVPLGGTAIFNVTVANTGDIPLDFDLDELAALGANPDNTTGGLDTVSVPGHTLFVLGNGKTQVLEVYKTASDPSGVNNTLNYDVTLPALYELSNEYTGSATDTCTVQQTGATRTIGFWKTHLNYTTHILDTHTLYGQSGPLGVNPDGTFQNGSIDLGWITLNSVQDVLGVLYADTSKNSDGSKRSKMCQACVIASKQLVGALLNSGLDNAAPVPTATIDQLIAALAAHTNRNLILSLGTALENYNSSGDPVEIIDSHNVTPGKATPKDAAAYADVSVADCPGF
jgi:uncharacterized repeat protein (TIGR01451 family)